MTTLTLDQTTTQEIPNQHHQPTMADQTAPTTPSRSSAHTPVTPSPLGAAPMTADTPQGAGEPSVGPTAGESQNTMPDPLAAYLVEDRKLQASVAALGFSYMQTGYRNPSDFYLQRKMEHDNYAVKYASTHGGQDPWSRIEDVWAREREAEEVVRQSRKAQASAAKQARKDLREVEAEGRRLVKIALYHFAVKQRPYTDASWLHMPKLAVKYGRDVWRISDLLVERFDEALPGWKLRFHEKFREDLERLHQHRGWEFPDSLAKALE
ncbi:hypothetical protein QBC39DRAFT_358580 [Podospora conica]|nr:hypothetical protein QBC39DRAFT_358580 [Schizothecium conicum]